MHDEDAAILSCYSHDDHYGEEARDLPLSNVDWQMMFWSIFRLVWHLQNETISINVCPTSIVKRISWIQACFISRCQSVCRYLSQSDYVSFDQWPGKGYCLSGRIWQKTDSVRLPSIKIADRLQFLTKSYELYHMDRAKRDLVRPVSSIWWKASWMSIAAYRAGIENAVASMGTALSQEHVEHLKRLTKKLFSGIRWR